LVAHEETVERATLIILSAVLDHARELGWSVEDGVLDGLAWVCGAESAGLDRYRRTMLPGQLGVRRWVAAELKFVRIA
jgi:hypothetical protein